MATNVKTQHPLFLQGSAFTGQLGVLLLKLYFFRHQAPHKRVFPAQPYTLFKLFLSQALAL